jgi:hypothetical protein
VEHSSYFGELAVRTNPALSDDDQMFAAGYIEGLLTADRIYAASLNTRCQLECDGSIPENLRAFVASNEAWVLQQVRDHPLDPTWMMMGSIYAQYQGLISGYRASEYSLDGHPLDDDMSFWVINSLGDMFEILPALDTTKRPDYAAMSTGALMG